MRKVLVGAASAAILSLGAAAPAALGAPNERACENGHGVLKAHATVPHNTQGNHQAHMSIPGFCGYGSH